MTEITVNWKKIMGQNVSAYIIQLMVITSAKWNKEPCNASMAEAILLQYHFTVWNVSLKIPLRTSAFLENEPLQRHLHSRFEELDYTLVYTAFLFLAGS